MHPRELIDTLRLRLTFPTHDPRLILDRPATPRHVSTPRLPRYHALDFSDQVTIIPTILFHGGRSSWAVRSLRQAQQSKPAGIPIHPCPTLHTPSTVPDTTQTTFPAVATDIVMGRPDPSVRSTPPVRPDPPVPFSTQSIDDRPEPFSRSIPPPTHRPGLGHMPLYWDGL